MDGQQIVIEQQDPSITTKSTRRVSGGTLFGIICLVLILILFIWSMIVYSGHSGLFQVQAFANEASSGGKTPVTYYVRNKVYNSILDTGTVMYAEGTLITVYYLINDPSKVNLVDVSGKVMGVVLGFISVVLAIIVIILMSFFYATARAIEYAIN